MLGANNPSIVNVVYITVNVSVISGLEYELAMINHHYSSSNYHGRLFCPDTELHVSELILAVWSPPFSDSPDFPRS